MKKTDLPNLREQKPIQLIFVSLVITSLTIRFAYVFNSDFTYLLNRFMTDDAFYYFSLADNIASGNGIVFNNNTPTNGFHPLYMLFLIPIYSVFEQGSELAVRISLFGLNLCMILTGITTYYIIREISDIYTATATAGIWLLNFGVLTIGMLGVETPIQTFLISILILYYIRNNQKYSFTRRQSVIIGTLIGLIFLARMDGVFIAIGFYSIILAERLHDTGTDRIRRVFSQSSDIILAGTVSVATVLPWLAYNVLVVGELLPVSSSAVKNLFLMNNNNSQLLAMVEVVREIAVGLKLFVLYGNTPNVTSEILMLIVFYGFLLLILGYYRDKTFPVIRNFHFLILGVALQYAYYLFQQLAWRPWYGLLSYLLLTVIIGVVIKLLVNSGVVDNFTEIINPKIGAVLLLLTLQILTLGAGMIAMDGITQDQNEIKREIAHDIENDYPNSTFASGGAGIYQYYTPMHDVVELGGVMNPDTYHARRNDNLTTYMRSRGVDFVIGEGSLRLFDNANVTVTRVRSYESLDGRERHIYNVTYNSP